MRKSDMNAGCKRLGPPFLNSYIRQYLSRSVITHKIISSLLKSQEEVNLAYFDRLIMDVKTEGNALMESTHWFSCSVDVGCFL
jgi:hypothetical protein